MHGSPSMGDVILVITTITASYAGVLALMAAVVAIGHIRSDRPVFERLYRIVFWLTIVGHLLMLVNRPALLLLAWIGPPRNPRGCGRIERNTARVLLPPVEAWRGRIHRTYQHIHRQRHHYCGWART
jgi:hypothetical protein